MKAFRILPGWLIAGVGLSLAVAVGAAAAPKSPNILVILSDDQGWGDLSVNGNSNLSTPNIDSLARDGARFDRFFVCPVCSPTRAEFLTGRYHPRGNVYSTSAGGERLNLDEKTIGDTFKAAGYATGAFGKWHNGMQYPYHPNGRGFEEFYGFCSGHWGDYFDAPMDHNGRIVTGRGFCIDDFTDRAMKFMERSVRQGRPFLAYLPYNTPHSPMQVPDRWWDTFKDRELALRGGDPRREDIAHTRAALAMCENIDWNVGRIFAKLDQLKIATNTLVLYFCDNGPNGARWNGGMKGRKGSTDEGGVRSPLLVRWPAAIQPGTVVPQIGGAIDLLPTLADVAGIKMAGSKPLDGISLKPLLLGAKVQWPERMIFSHWNRKVSVRTQQHRLDDQGRLYDLTRDGGQERDIAGRHPELTARLRGAVVDWKREVLAGLGKDDRPFVIGHPDHPFTQIPARDAKFTGNVKRSNRFPNCSYLTNWTSLEDRITWEAEVPADGRFAVEIHYACAKTDVGAEVELSFNGDKLRGKVTKPNEVPARGGEHDRTPRQESYVKDWAVLPLGTIDLKRGKGAFTLRALKIPGKAVMDFRLVQLTRVP